MKNGPCIAMGLRLTIKRTITTRKGERMKLKIATGIILTVACVANAAEAFRGKVANIGCTPDGLYCWATLSGLTKQVGLSWVTATNGCDGQSTFQIEQNKDRSVLNLLIYAQAQGQTAEFTTQGTCDQDHYHGTGIYYVTIYP